MPKNSTQRKRNAQKQRRDAECPPETISVTVYGGDLEKYSEAKLPVPDGTFGIQISRPEKEVFI